MNHLNYTLSILFILMLFSCSEEKKQHFYIKDGLIYQASSNVLYTGTIKDSVLDKKMEYDIVKGVKEGRFLVFYSNGNPETIGYMKNNKNEGKWSYHYPNGQVESEGFFKNDVAEGKWVWFYDDGKLKESGVFKNGKREGEWFMYERSGEISEQANFINGEKIEAKTL